MFTVCDCLFYLLSISIINYGEMLCFISTLQRDQISLKKMCQQNIILFKFQTNRIIQTFLFYSYTFLISHFVREVFDDTQSCIKDTNCIKTANIYTFQLMCR